MNSRISYRMPPKKSQEIFAEAAKIARKIYIDELDCSKSMARTESSKNFQEVMDMVFVDGQRSHQVFIFRDQSFLPQEYLDETGKNPNRNYWDVGLSTFGSPSYFIFIELEEQDGFDLAKKYKLTPVQ
jgi:hypothetical protein